MKPRDALKVARVWGFGSTVSLRRGGHEALQPGQFRQVLATYIGARKFDVCCRLEEDDPDACVGYCTKKGDVGWWSRSIMSPID